jgi:diguanylate cyclase (GGDEF)-like protein
MSRDLEKDLESVKRRYFELETLHQEERECLSKVINVLGLAAGRQEEMMEPVRAITRMAGPNETLHVDGVESELAKLKDILLAETASSEVDGDADQAVAALKDQVTGVCRLLKKVMMILLEGFYPVPKDLRVHAERIDLDCSGEPGEIDFEGPVGDLLRFADALKQRISEDFRLVNDTFLTLLEQVKELEERFASAFGGERQLKEIEYFEMKVAKDADAIMATFDIHTTVEEIKRAVITKIENIKEAVSLKKEEDIRRARLADEQMRKLRERIAETEEKARDMSRRAEMHRLEAMKDGLTGLFNRKAFDLRLQGAIKRFTMTKEPFCLILFDVNRFKEINDTFGHVAGDTVLKAVSTCLRESFREQDFISRYGGDEFVAIIDGLSREMAEEKIRLFQTNLRKRRFVSQEKGDLQLTVSAGVSISQPDDSEETVLARADMAMYAEKSRSS